MEKKKPEKKLERKGEKEQEFNEDLFDKTSTIDELDSDGSGSAFEETERVNEDNFDDLSEK